MYYIVLYCTVRTVLYTHFYVVRITDLSLLPKQVETQYVDAIR